MNIPIKKRVYHGTYLKNVPLIFEKGFDINTNSCASFSKDRASYYGDCIISFDFTFYINVSNFTFFIRDLIQNDNIIPLLNFKPKKLTIN